MQLKTDIVNNNGYVTFQDDDDVWSGTLTSNRGRIECHVVGSETKTEPASKPPDLSTPPPYPRQTTPHIHLEQTERRSVARIKRWNNSSCCCWCFFVETAAGCCLICQLKEEAAARCCVCIARQSKRRRSKLFVCGFGVKNKKLPLCGDCCCCSYKKKKTSCCSFVAVVCERRRKKRVLLFCCVSRSERGTVCMLFQKWKRDKEKFFPIFV